MRQLVSSDQEKCVGCNRCTRVCPIETANLTYQDDDGNIKVRVDFDQCISCGECIGVCKHSARGYIDDTEQLFADLRAGVPVSVIAAPSIRTNIYEWRRLFTLLRESGVRFIYDVSLGADICIWAHLRHIQAGNTGALITQPCPAIVTYCERHRQDLLPRLSPVHSPMACAAIYMRQYRGIDTKIAALSPCIAKANEFDETGLIDYNVTYAKLLKYLADNEISLPAGETGFDHDDSGLGALFPSPGGLKENIEFYLGKSVRIDRAEGHGVYRSLDAYAQTDARMLPAIFDVLNCAGGCNSGTGCLHEKSLFEIESTMEVARQSVAARISAGVKTPDKFFDDTLRIGDFMRTYTAQAAPRPELTEAEIDAAFALLGKDDYVKQNFNCGACGSDSCRDMARKIALKINIPVNCIVKSRDDAREDHRMNIELAERNAEYIELISTIGYNLSSMNESDSREVALESIKALCLTLHETSLLIWRREKDGDGNVFYKSVYRWLNEGELAIDTVREEQAAGIFGKLMAGTAVTKTLTEMDEQERQLFVPLGILSTCAVPIMLRGSFWGFAAINNKHEKAYTEEQISLVAAVSMLLVSSLIESELNENLVAAREEALLSSKAKSEFLSRMSHEMRTPMNAIIGMAKIAENTTDHERLRSCLESIGTSSQHLLGLINDILDMSKIEAGKFELSYEPLNIHQVLKKTCNILSDSVQKKNMNLTVSVEGDAPFDYIGDDLRLSQVLTNILSNAVKFTPENGSITLKVTQSPAADGFDTLQFIVADTGIGMTDEQIGRLFTSFEQADGSISRRFGGTGLGLAISKNIVEKMNGTITVESEPDKGSTFTVTVRLERAEPSRPLTEETADMTEIPDFSCIKLLLAEDVEINREIFAALLGDTNVDIDFAENGRVALERFSANPDLYDIIIMDIQMPDMDGIEATTRIRALDSVRAKTVPIIAMTANAFKEDIDRCIACGMDDHLAKPIDVDMVRAKIRQYTDVGRGNGAHVV